MRYLQELKKLNDAGIMGDTWHITLFDDGSGELVLPATADEKGPLDAFCQYEHFSALVEVLIKSKPETVNQAVKYIQGEYSDFINNSIK